MVSKYFNGEFLNSQDPQSFLTSNLFILLFSEVIGLSIGAGFEPAYWPPWTDVSLSRWENRSKKEKRKRLER
jgi:hypothetical protein